jgi:hypothetical protein
MKSSSAKPVLPADWPQVLAKIQQGLDQGVAHADERARGLDANPSPPALDQTAGWQENVGRLEEHLRGFKSCIQQAERAAAELDAELHAGEESVRQWLTTADNVRQRLAKGELPAV